MSLDSPDQSGPPGSTLFYSGSITNTTGTDLFLDLADIAFVTNAPSSSYLRDYSDEFLNTLGIIPLTGYTGPMFVISWLGSAPSGASGDGRFELTAASPATPESLAAGFTASVIGAPTPDVPEPMVGALVMLGAAVLATRRRRASR